MVGTITIGQRRSHDAMKPVISAASLRLECTRIASAPAAWYASARRSASSIEWPEISASVRATMEKAGSV